jgi:ADP-ribosylation factor related protein 1
VFVIDSTDVPRIESEVVEMLREVIENEETEGVPVLVLANKQDREESIEIAELKEVVNPVVVRLGARDSRVLPVSALEGCALIFPKFEDKGADNEIGRAWLKPSNG